MEVIVHGGAGSPPDEPAQRQDHLEDAAAAVSDTESPLSAVETAVRPLESDPLFNAGIGGAVQSDGVVRTDAGIMTDAGRIGAVGSLEGVEHAVSAARVVLDETPHGLLVGQQAAAVAGSFGIATDVELRTASTRDRFDSASPPLAIEDQLAWVRDRYDGPQANEDRHGTVGAVATDGERIAAATSTGGRWFALAGRVGDVPQVGAGFYASPAGGASATGNGEAIVRTAVARSAVEHLGAGLTPNRVATEAIRELESATGAQAGVIVLAPDGRAGWATNAESMQTARG